MIRAALFLFAAAGVALLAGTATPQAPKADPKGKEPPKADPKAKDAPKAGDPKFSLKKAKLDELILGQHISGPRFTKDDLKGRVILLSYWGVKCPACLAAMPGQVALNNDLGDFGLLLVGSSVQREGTQSQVRAAAAGQGANFAIHTGTGINTDDLDTIPHCFVFDHTGACVYRGLPAGAEASARTAVANAVLAAAGKDKFAGPVQDVAKDLKAGKPPATLLARLAGIKGGDAGADAQALLDALTAQGRAKLKAAEEEKDPVAAFQLVEKLPTAFKGTPVAAKATELAAKLKKEKAVVAELAARPALAVVKKLETPLVGTADEVVKPADYAKTHAVALKPLKAKVMEMKKTWPDAPSTKEAVEIAERYGIDLTN